MNEVVIQELTCTRGHRIATSRSSSIQAQDFQRKTSYIRVTRDESQVSVGGMLTLDQVLGDPWSS
jgi:hypothetical protein